MKTRHRYIFYLMIISTVFAACSKGTGDTATDSSGGGSSNDPHEYVPGDTTAPVLIIYTPVANQVFTNGNSINVTGKITDELGLYRGNIRITNDANGDLLRLQQYEIHGVLSYDFNISYPASITAVSNYTVTVTFEDHGLNSTTKSVKVKINP